LRFAASSYWTRPIGFIFVGWLHDSILINKFRPRIETIAAMTGCRHAGTRIVAVSHSVGGGLAEATAYTNGRIRYVYAFNSFPVGGFFGPDPAVQARNKIGLGVDIKAAAKQRAAHHSRPVPHRSGRRP
jgi:hypothetical protein